MRQLPHDAQFITETNDIPLERIYNKHFFFIFLFSHALQNERSANLKPRIESSNSNRNKFH